MGAGNQYRVIIRRIIEQEAVGQPSHSNAEVIAICDDVSGNYLVMVVGWSGAYRHDHAFLHLRLKDWLLPVFSGCELNGLNRYKRRLK